MIKFPYGIADFGKIVTQGYYYCDRTHAIPYLERAESMLFIRPRRFGKSLLLSMLEHYYDVARAEEFEHIFGNLAIGKQPTALRNQYFILRLDFSCVDTTGTPDDVKRSLYNHVNACIVNFIRYYRDRGYNLSGFEVNYDDALFSLKTLVGAAQSAGHAIYLLIDEYDNFANTIMMLPVSDSRDRYKALVHDEGVLRTLFKAIKSSTGSSMFDRVFITGVSPVVMSDITSGHNVARDIFFAPEFSDLCGFHEAEVKKTLHDIARSCNLGEEKANEALSMMRTWYNGYAFVPIQGERLYNPTLCLYFFDEFQSGCRYPDEMLDANLAVDESKLQYTTDLPGGRELVLMLSERSAVVLIQKISKRFGLSEMLTDASRDRVFLVSFLYYFGVLTLAGKTDQGELRLRVPNLVIQGLYVERVQRMLLPDPVLRDRGRDAAKKVYQKGDMGPLCAFVQKDYFAVFKNRDYALANELTLKTCFLTLLYNDILYIMDSEPEIGRRYADLTLIIRPDRRYLKIFDVLIEFKFIRLKTLSLTGEAVKNLSDSETRALPAVRRVLEEGKAQAMVYGRELAAKYPGLRLKTFVVAALAFERICFIPVNVDSNKSNKE